MPHKSLIIALTLATPTLAQVDPYTFYGGDIVADEKSEAIEACEYGELVVNQRCNERMNKSACIREVHAECRERYRALDDDERSREPR